MKFTLIFIPRISDYLVLLRKNVIDIKKSVIDIKESVIAIKESAIDNINNTFFNIIFSNSFSCYCAGAFMRSIDNNQILSFNNIS